MGEGSALVTDPSGLRPEPHYLRHFNWCVKYITIFEKENRACPCKKYSKPVHPFAILGGITCESKKMIFGGIRSCQRKQHRK